MSTQDTHSNVRIVRHTWGLSTTSSLVDVVEVNYPRRKPLLRALAAPVRVSSAESGVMDDVMHAEFT
jgi:hypothetical protein